MLILLKCICFGLWFFMMMAMIVACQRKENQPEQFFLQLEDPMQAEGQIYDSLRQLQPDLQLSIKISEYQPTCSELAFIASRIARKNPSILIQFLELGGN